MWRGITHSCGHHWHYEHTLMRSEHGYEQERETLARSSDHPCPKCIGLQPPYPFNGTDELRAIGTPLSLHGADGVAIPWQVKP
jgi:hypothetical protein